ncbi:MULTISPECIES: DMT family transporter [unclassified Nocardioides]|uniref:DMT family transporter n=1 Tax=unclassified Nocardioides TaxID=2615069 RepID=UPI000A963B7B|nr:MULTISPECIES: multidrug efflux SMR transporter [unclassified Nocardioides]
MILSAGLLAIAITVEVAATSALGRTDGFRHLGWTALVLTGYVASIGLLAIVVREIPVSVAYAVWAGVGTAAVAVIGATVLGEPMSLTKAAAIAMIVLGVVVLNLSGAH